MQSLKVLFGEARRTFEARFLYVPDDEEKFVQATGFLTWYDAREAHATRSEHRLYFPENDATLLIRPGDLAVILRLANGEAMVVFAPHASTVERQLLWLFGVESQDPRFQVRITADWNPELGFAARQVLRQLGLEPEVAPVEEESDLDLLVGRYGAGFPSTREFSAFARSRTPDVDPKEDPDGTLMAWLEREEALFRQLERHLLLDRLREGFDDDVDAFISFSLSVQNRRKSRVGHALELHAAAILDAHQVSYSHGAVTEGSSRPDFLFPSIEAYRDTSRSAASLAMLGVKTTCKDRWRQVLAEADRIERKHLLTLEPGISPTQLSEMHAREVQLVVPRSLQASYQVPGHVSILTLGEFLMLPAVSPLQWRGVSE